MLSRRLDAGTMDQRVTLQRRGTSTNSLGEPVDTWEDVVTVWAEVKPLRGREYFAAGQMQATADHRVRTRHNRDIAGVRTETAQNRFLWRGQPLEISAPPMDVDGGKHTLEIMCTQGVRDGR